MTFHSTASCRIDCVRGNPSGDWGGSEDCDYQISFTGLEFSSPHTPVVKHMLRVNWVTFIANLSDG